MIDNKRCPKCKIVKNKSEFRPHKNRKDGLQAYCRECDKKQQKIYYQKYKKKRILKYSEVGKIKGDWFKNYKKTLKCNRCGENHPACLQFHHLDPSKKDKAVSAIIRSWSRERILKEIGKCEVLCANCHFKEHYDE